MEKFKRGLWSFLRTLSITWLTLYFCFNFYFEFDVTSFILLSSFLFLVADYADVMVHYEEIPNVGKYSVSYNSLASKIATLERGKKEVNVTQIKSVLSAMSHLAYERRLKIQELLYQTGKRRHEEKLKKRC